MVEMVLVEMDLVEGDNSEKGLVVCLDLAHLGLVEGEGLARVKVETMVVLVV